MISNSQTSEENSISDSHISTTIANTTHQSKLSIPESWQWILAIMDEAHLPKLGLPVQWDTTKEKHALTAFDPNTNEKITIHTGKSKKTKGSPIGFIESTSGKTPMPGTETPAAARLTRYLEPRFHEHFVRGSHGEILVPCLAHGDYVQVESLETDHAQAKEEIQKRQKSLVARLNNDPRFANFVMRLDGINKFFVKLGEKYYGTLYFYELYFNDIDNLWLICGACNLHKSDVDSLSWFRDQWLYGDEFLDYIGRLRNDGILIKTQNKQGLGEVAIAWYWDRHAHYATISKRLMQDVVTPIQVLNQRVDRVVGLVRQGADDRRLQRHIASLDFRVALLSELAILKGIDMPRAPSEPLHSSSDEENYIKLIDQEGNSLPVTLDVYNRSTSVFRSKMKRNIQEGLLSTMIDVMAEDSEAEKSNTVNKSDDNNEPLNSKKLRLGGA